MKSSIFLGLFNWTGAVLVFGRTQRKRLRTGAQPFGFIRLFAGVGCTRLSSLKSVALWDEQCAQRSTVWWA